MIRMIILSKLNLSMQNSLSGGFFIEAGAWDGEDLSNSLHFEIVRNWTGLLVEPVPEGFKVGIILWSLYMVNDTMAIFVDNNLLSLYCYEKKCLMLGWRF